MPGSTWDLGCPACQWSSDVRTGAFMPRAPGEGVHYVQYVCRRCAIHFSARSDEAIDRCLGCGQPLDEWDDLIQWRSNGIFNTEVVGGACPACEAPLDARLTGNWD
jgi:hypothetical protein